MIDAFMLGVQIAILILVAVNAVFAFRTTKNTRQAALLVEQYRREIGWLTERMGMLEQRVPGAIRFK
jgi:hypothetical protein